MKLFAILAATAALCSSAIAADLKLQMPTKAAVVPANLPAWTGLYGGCHLGYGINLSDTTVTATSTFGGLAADLGAAPRGPMVGCQAGFDWQPANNLVIGVRLDGDWANMTSSGNLAMAGVTALSVSNATNWLGDADIRVGYSGFGNHVLPYVNGGFAFGGRKPNLAALATPAVAASDTSTGWNIGGGIETRITQNISVFAEADYYNLGNPSLSAMIGGTTLVTSSIPMQFAVGKVGINLRQ
jgi:outer membrane immunogenic protein